MSTPLTIEMVAAILPNARANGLDNEWDYLLKTLSDYEINTKNRVAAFLGNVAAESGELYYTTEIADGWAYEGRADLGNIYAGDGPRYRGHGYIQTTGRDNHRKVGEALGIDAEGNPTILTEMPWCWYSAGWYWRYGSSWGDLNDYADDGDFDTTVLGVRGGPDPNRTHYWWDAMEALPDDLEIPEATPEPVGEDGDIDGWPTERASADKQGWLVVGEKYLAVPSLPDTDFKTEGVWLKSASGLIVPAEPEEPVGGSDWSWWDRPESGPYLEPFALGDGSYADAHPERYDDAWLPEVEKVARYIVDEYGLWCNTYYGHPPPEMVGGVWYDAVSLDIWGPGYRGDSSQAELVTTAFYDIFENGKRPWIRWCIRNGWIWDPYNEWRLYWEYDPYSDGPHVHHGHLTLFSLLEA